MSAKLIIFHGLPGSGKSTARDEYIATHPNENVVVINRDDLRTNLFGESYHKKNPDKKSEAKVTALQQAMFKKALAAGDTIIDDNTNLNPRFIRRTFNDAMKYGATIEQQYFDIPVEECKKRNRYRRSQGGRFVPEFVIDQMAQGAYDEAGHLKKYIYSRNGVSRISVHTPNIERFNAYNEELAARNPLKGKAVVILDCDSTLANNTHFSEFYLNNPDTPQKDFEGFYESIAQTEVNSSVRDMANSMRDNDDLNIILVTGRDTSHPDELIDFIERSGVKLSRVITKYEGDQRPDFEFKQEVIKELRKEGLIPVHAIDDREGSARTFEGEGILVSRVIPEKIKLVSGSKEPPLPAKAPEINTIYGSGYCIRCGSKLKQGNIGKRCAQKSNI